MANFMAAIDRFLPNQRKIRRVGFKTRPISTFVQSADLRVTVKAFYDATLKRNVFEVFSNELSPGNGAYTYNDPSSKPKLLASGFMDPDPQPTASQATLP